MTIIDESSDLTLEQLEAIVSPPAATKIDRGVTLFTKDGRHNGNAIVVQKVGQARQYLVNLPGFIMVDVWLVETDFGNQMKLTEREISTLFNLGWVHSYPRWFDDRLKLITERIKEL